jgi:hypothetical protein
VDLPKLGRSDISPDKPFSFVGRGVKNSTTVGCDYFAREQAVLHKGFLELALGLLPLQKPCTRASRVPCAHPRLGVLPVVC